MENYLKIYRDSLQEYYKEYSRGFLAKEVYKANLEDLSQKIPELEIETTEKEMIMLLIDSFKKKKTLSEITEILASNNIDLSDVLDAFIDDHGIIGVGLVTLADNVAEYIRNWKR